MRVDRGQNRRQRGISELTAAAHSFEPLTAETGLTVSSQCGVHTVAATSHSRGLCDVSAHLLVSSSPRCRAVDLLSLRLGHSFFATRRG